MRSKAKMVNYGIVYGLSAYGLADRLQIPQEEAQEFIDRYLARFPAVAQFMKDAVDAGRAARLRLDAVRPPPPDPEIRARNWQTRKLGERLAVNSSSRARPRTSSRSRWCARTTRSPPRACRPHDPADPRRAAVRGPPEEMERATEIVTREMVGAAELDPPLAVDAGVGPNWLDAK
jgi:DNA polymerase-1